MSDEMVLDARPWKRKATSTAFDPKVFLAKADAGRTVAQYRKNQIIFSQGDAADAVFYVIKGRVKFSVVSEHGKEAVVALLGTDEFCGEGCLAGQTLRMATARAMTDCEVMRIEKGAMTREIGRAHV